MASTRSRWFFLTIVGGLSVLMLTTTPRLLSHTRFGLEFRGGYEILYVTAPKAGETQVSHAALLETAWDKAEENLKPVNPEKWTTIDKSIDRVLAALRSGQPDAAACKSTLETLIAKFNVIDKQL